MLPSPSFSGKGHLHSLVQVVHPSIPPEARRRIPSLAHLVQFQPTAMAVLTIFHIENSMQTMLKG